VVSKSKKSAESLYWETWNSPFGAITVACSDKGLRQVELSRVIRRNKEGVKEPAAGWVRAGASSHPAAKFARQTIAELKDYAAGKLKRFTVPLDLQGTPFQLKVWKALCSIPYGGTRSYKEIARQVGNPKASRAVGMANHWNPVAIVVPCHRVVASDGSLGGYAGGLDLKAKILQMEAAG